MSDIEKIIDEANPLLFTDWDAAIRMYEKALRLEPDSERACCGKALACMFSGRHEDAVACMRDLLRFRPGAAYVHGFMGVALERGDKNREALACYERMLELEPGDVAARFRKERMLHVIYPEKSNVIGILSAVSSKTDDPVAVKTQRAIQSAMFGDKDSEPTGEEVVAMMPGLVQMADILFKRGAENSFANMLDAYDGPAPDGESAEDLLDRAAKMADAGMPANALGLVDAAMAKDPGLAEAHSVKATYLARLGRHAEAAECMEEFLRMRPGDTNALCARGMLLEKVGRPAEAAACYEIWIKAQPGHMPARHLMCGLLAASGNAEGLAECYRAALEAEPDGEDDADAQENMRAEYADLERCARAAGSMTAGFARFRKGMGVGMETMWGRGYGRDARRPGKASKRRVRAGRRR